MSPSKASLATLSLDLLIRIMEDLHIIDIIALRQTCKTLCTSTHERIVWLTKLKESCRKNHIYLPTFPLPEMTSAQLERAATSPHRSLRALTRGNTKPRPKTSSDPYGQLLRRHNVRKILRAKRYPLHRPVVYLVPGGRWLLRFEDEIELYDLGYPGAPQVDKTEETPSLLVPVASHKREFGRTGCFDVYQSPAGKSLRILQKTVGGHGVDIGRGLLLLEINPQDPNPAFVEVFRYKPKTEDYITTVALYGDDLFMIQDDALKVQNIKTRAWTWWGLDSEMVYQRILPRKYDLTIIHDTGAYVYPYPTLDHTDQPIFEDSIPPNSDEDRTPKLRPAVYTLNHMDDFNRDYVMGEIEAGVLNGWYYSHGGEGKDTDVDEVPLIWDKPQWTIVSDDEDEDGGDDDDEDEDGDGGDEDKDGDGSEDDGMKDAEDDGDDSKSDNEDGGDSGGNQFTPGRMTTRNKPKASSPSPSSSSSDSDPENDVENEPQHAKENPRLDLCRYEVRISLSPSSPDNPLTASSSSNPRFAGVSDKEEIALDEEYDLWEAENLGGLYPLTCAAFPMQGIRLCEGALVSVWGRPERVLVYREGYEVKGLKPKAKDHKAYVNVNSLPHLAKGPEHVPLSKAPGDLKKDSSRRERKKAMKGAVGLFELDSWYEKQDGDQEVYSSFCPFAGRVVYLCDDEDEVDPVIVVFDLF